MRRPQEEVNLRGSINPEELIDNGTFCVGNPDACIRAIEKYEAAGVEQIMPVFEAAHITHEMAMSSIRLFGKYIIPYFKEKEKTGA